MKRAMQRIVSRACLAVFLAAAAALLPGLAGPAAIPYSVAAVLLLAALVYNTSRSRPAFDIVTDLAVVFLAPLALEPLADALGLPAAAWVAVVPVLPALFLLDDSLKRHVRRRRVFAAARSARQVTPTFTALASAALSVMVLAIIIGRSVLLPAGSVVLLYLVIVFIGTTSSVPKRPFTAGTVLKRVIAGTSGSMSLQLTGRDSTRLYCRAAPEDAWVQARPEQFTFRGDGVRLELSFTPALAGDCRPVLHISALDERGLIQTDQRLEPLHLHVIPMARYAEWLAMRYLEQAEAGVVSGAGLPDTVRSPKRGTDYLESRAYQPGDPMKTIDWKHTAKLNQLIVNKFGESGRQGAIIAANLEAGSSAEADRLAFNLITVAMTLARENVSAALAVYDRRGVVQDTGVLDPFEVLKQALSLARQITPVEVAGRHMEPTDIARVRRNIRQLRQAESEPARRLLDILNFEHRAVEEVARGHPATLALSAVTGRVSAPATIFLVSALNHDAEAVMVTAEKLARRKFTIVPVENR